MGVLIRRNMAVWPLSGILQEDVYFFILFTHSGYGGEEHGLIAQNHTIINAHGVQAFAAKLNAQ